MKNEKPIQSIALFSDNLQVRFIGLELDLDALIPQVETRIENIRKLNKGRRAEVVSGLMEQYLDHIKTVRKERGEITAQKEARFLLCWICSTPFWMI